MYASVGQKLALLSIMVFLKTEFKNIVTYAWKNTLYQQDTIIYK